MTTARNPLPAAAVRRILQATTPWLSCDDCFRLLDVYVEAALAGALDPAWTAMETHLSACRACHEEAAALVALVARDLGTDPEAALGRISRPAD
jgi:hypothetical protein